MSKKIFFVSFLVVTFFSSACMRQDHPKPSKLDPAVIVVPEAPRNVEAKSGDSQVLLSWSATSKASSYNVYWSNNAAIDKKTAEKLERIMQPETTHRGLQNGKKYYYVVTAVGTGGESQLSQEVSAVPKK